LEEEPGKETPAIEVGEEPGIVVAGKVRAHIIHH
jgi:hypothetical protein